MGQAVVGCFPHSCLLCAATTAYHTIDFGTCTRAELRSFEVPFSFVIERTALMHGLGCWFDVCFEVMLPIPRARVRAPPFPPKTVSSLSPP